MGEPDWLEAAARRLCAGQDAPEISLSTEYVLTVEEVLAFAREAHARGRREGIEASAGKCGSLRASELQGNAIAGALKCEDAIRTLLEDDHG